MNERPGGIGLLGAGRQTLEDMMKFEAEWKNVRSAPRNEFSRAFLCDEDGRTGEGEFYKGRWTWRHNEKLAFPKYWMPLPPNPCA